MSDNIREQFKLLQRAKKTETMGNSQRALDMYLELHKKYDPNTSDAYERPAIILERLKRFDEAIALCKSAIDGIKNDTISGTVDKFEKRLESIYDKMKEETVENSPTVSYHFHILGFYKSKNYLKIILGSFYLISIALSVIFKDVFIAAGLILGLYGFKYLFDSISFNIKEKKLLLIISTILLAATIYAVLQWPQAFKENIIFVDTTESLEGAEQIFTPTKELPMVKDTHLKAARDLIEKDRAVLESIVILNENDLTLALILFDNTSRDTSRELLETFAKALSDIVAEDNNLKSSSKSYYGELYDFYHLNVTASESGASILSKGNKNTKSSRIIWE